MNADTLLKIDSEMPSSVLHAVDMLKRDMEKVFLKNRENKFKQSLIIVDYDRTLKEEGYKINFRSEGKEQIMEVRGADDLGVIYGLLFISKEYLGVDPFWYFADIELKQRQEVKIHNKEIISPTKKVKYRGWFVNDEVCLIGWAKEYPPEKEVWYPVFETLLRLGGNMVIPGTDLPKDGVHWALASEMGLWITHHHAEPLGAEMFKRAYPDKQASYKQHPDLYEKLWEDAIKEQKDKKVIWVLSFRGQGDAPFWSQDPSYDTDEKRGQLISDVLHRQLELLHQYIDHPECCVALYGELSELYRKGMLHLPEDIIKVWADNGYGKMVSRRNGNEDFRISSLPEGKSFGRQGIYYHITFHDLQASNHLTMFPNEPDLIKEELKEVFRQGGDDYVLLNSGNIRMHTYPLDMVSELWNTGDLNIEEHLTAYLERFYSSHYDKLKNNIKAYFDATLTYGKHADNRAGEEIYHHPARLIVGKWMTNNDSTCEELIWATGFVSFEKQVAWFGQLTKDAREKWEKLNASSRELLNQLTPSDQQRDYDQFHVQVELHDSGNSGLHHLSMAYAHFQKEQYPESFVYASYAIWEYQRGIEALKKSEHGKWKNFYRADWLTNIKRTIESLDALRKFIRMHGDSPDFFLWYKQYLMPEEEKHIYLENTHREPLSDDKLAQRLSEKLFAKKQSN